MEGFSTEILAVVSWCCPICLNGILNKEHFDSYLLVVRGILALLKRTLTENEILRSEYDLLKFVGEFQSIYGLGGSEQ